MTTTKVTPETLQQGISIRRSMVLQALSMIHLLSISIASAVFLLFP
jgi:hypothetical protein